MSDTAVAGYIDTNNQTQRVGINAPLPITDAQALFLLQQLISQLPVSLGQTTSSLSLSVALASDYVGKTTVSLPVTPNVVAGGQTIATTAKQMPTATLAVGVTIKALPTNKGRIFGGGSGVNTTLGDSGTGFTLDPGESIFWTGSALSTLWTIGAVAGDFLTYFGS